MCRQDLRLKHDEANLQADIITWFNLQYPYLEGLLVGYVAGLNLDVKTRVRMKRMGLRAGFPDMMLLVPRLGYSHALFIELKSEKGRVAKIQSDYHEKLRLLNYTVIICRSFIESANFITKYIESVPDIRKRFGRP